MYNSVDHEQSPLGKTEKMQILRRKLLQGSSFTQVEYLFFRKFSVLFVIYIFLAEFLDSECIKLIDICIDDELSCSFWSNFDVF